MGKKSNKHNNPIEVSILVNDTFVAKQIASGFRKGTLEKNVLGGFESAGCIGSEESVDGSHIHIQGGDGSKIEGTVRVASTISRLVAVGRNRVQILNETGTRCAAEQQQRQPRQQL